MPGAVTRPPVGCRAVPVVNPVDGVGCSAGPQPVMAATRQAPTSQPVTASAGEGVFKMVQHAPFNAVAAGGWTDHEATGDLLLPRRVGDPFLVLKMDQHPVGDLRIASKTSVSLIANQEELANAVLLLARIHVAFQQHVMAVDCTS